MRWMLLFLAVLLPLPGLLAAADTASIPLADGFEIPVGRNGKAYYKARGVRPNGHLGEDWNGVGGGNTDLGDEIYATADGIVVYAQNFHMGWGNVVIIRHAYLEGGETKYLDSLYGHLLDFTVHVGQVVKRGQQIARMGTNNGMYEAHLHFEMRKNIHVGMFRSSFPRDWSVYWSPTEFVAAHQSLPGDGRIVAVPINTFPTQAPPILASHKVSSPIASVASAADRVVAGQLLTRGLASRPNPRADLVKPPKTIPAEADLPKPPLKPAPGVKVATYKPAPVSPASTSKTPAVKPPAPKVSVVKPAAAKAAIVKPTGRTTTSTAAKSTPAPSKPAEKKSAPVRHPLFRTDQVQDMKILEN